MAPKRYTRGLPIVTDDVRQAVLDARAARLPPRSAPFPPSSSSAPPLAVSVAQGTIPATSVALIPTEGPTRVDVATVRNTRRGGIAAALERANVEGMEAMVAELNRDREAASGRGGAATLIRTWQRFHREASARSGGDSLGPWLPLTPTSIIAVGSFFKAGGYRSYPNYWGAARVAHIEAGHLWSEHLEITGKWVCRSVLRGIGPAKQSRPYAIQKLLTLASEEAPVVADGPTWPLRAILWDACF